MKNIETPTRVTEVVRGTCFHLISLWLHGGRSYPTDLLVNLFSEPQAPEPVLQINGPFTNPPPSIQMTVAYVVFRLLQTYSASLGQELPHLALLEITEVWNQV
jgi:hypothetical protein